MFRDMGNDRSPRLNQSIRLTKNPFRPPSRLALLAPLSLAVTFWVSLTLLVLTSQSKTGQVAVFYSPLIKADRALEFAASAGALILRPGGWRNVVIVSEPDPAARRQLYQAGAWFLIETGSALGCVVALGCLI